ncbi:hypothetical protein MMC14_001346 [Varicellaria rhodocarpa]|nr:hypothetical protein [Varicellaria rhodocarpa]
MSDAGHMSSNAEATEDSLHNSLQDYIELPYHGNCQNCHHFHIRSIIRYSPSQSKLTKFSCEKCQKLMFALGGNSTQTSLASVLTTTIEDSSPSRDLTSLDRFMPCTDDLQEADHSGGVQEDGVGEVEMAGQELVPTEISRTQTHRLSSPIRGDEGSTVPNGAILPRSDTLISHATLPGQIPGSETASPSHQTTATPNSPQLLSPKTKTQRLFHFVRKHIPRRQKSLQNSPRQVVSRVVPEMKDCSTMTEFPPRSSRGESSRFQLLSSMPSNTHFTASEGHTAHPDEEIKGLEHGTRIKKERLEAKRREATLRRSTMSARKCFCNEGCHCYRGAGRATPQSHASLNTSNAPQHHLGENLIEEVQSSQCTSDPPRRHHSPARRVAFIGAHLDDVEPSPERPVSSSMPDARRPSHISSSTPTSQATTAIESRSSEARIATQASRRSASLPALPFHDFLQVVEQSRPALLDYLRGLDALGHPIRDRRPAQSEPDRETSERDSSEASVSEDIPEGIIPFRTSTTSLSHLELEDEATLSGPSSSHRTPRGESSSRTPQPQNSEILTGSSPLESDEVAVALEELSGGTRQNTQVTDFGDPI